MGIAYNPKVVTNGLVLALDAGNTKSYPGSGTAWTDLTGRGNTGTLTNGPTYSSTNGGSLVFDGVDDCVVLPSGADYETANVTFEAWVNLQDRGNRHIVMLRWSGLSLEVNANRTVVMYNLSSEGQQGAFTTTRQITFNQWSQIVGIYDATSKDLKTYIDGELGATRTNTQNTTYSVGVNKISGNDYGGTVLGNVAAVRQYNRALSAAEIKQNFNATRGRYGI